MELIGQKPERRIVVYFLAGILIGMILLMLPVSSANRPISFVNALFTSTSAVCVTGLTVLDTGHDFSFFGQIVILALIQLGGLGIVVFGAVFALLLGQAFSLRESVAMQDLLSARTVSRIGNMIGFVFFDFLTFFFSFLIFLTIGGYLKYV